MSSLSVGELVSRARQVLQEKNLPQQQQQELESMSASELVDLIFKVSSSSSSAAGGGQKKNKKKRQRVKLEHLCLCPLIHQPLEFLPLNSLFKTFILPWFL